MKSLLQMEGRSRAARSGTPSAPEVDEYPVERVAEITWLKADDIVEAARMYAQSKPAAIHWGVPIDMTPAITPTVQAITALWCLTGNLDVPGGNVIARYAFDAVAYALPGAKGVIKLKSPEMDKPRVGKDVYGPLRKFIWRAQTDLTLDQIFTEEPYPIKGMWIQTCNPLSGIGMDPKKWLDALKKLDFVVVVDLFHTPTTQYADVVLPAGTFLEKDGVRTWWVPMQSINKAITVPDCRPDVEINFELAKRFDPDFRWETIHDLFDEIVKPSGLTFGQLQEQGWAYPPDGHPSAPLSPPRARAAAARPPARFPDPHGQGRAARGAARGVGPGPAAPVRGAAVHTGHSAGAVQGVPADPVHGPAVGRVFPRGASQHPVAARARPRPGD